MNIIAILWLRQIKRYLRSRARIVGSLGQPLLFLVALGFGFGPIYERAGGGDYLQFIAPGVISMGILFTAMFSGVEIIWDRQFGFLKEMFVAPVPRMYIMIGRTLGGATVATIQGIIVFFIALIVGFRPESLLLLPLAFLVMFLIASLFTALGTGIACLLKDFQGFQLIMNFLIMPMFFLSGALYPLQDLPIVISILARIDPLSYGIDALRYSLLGTSHFSLGLDLTILSAVTFLFLLIGSRLFARIQM